jgi:hypothetical protein
MVGTIANKPGCSIQCIRIFTGSKNIPCRPIDDRKPVRRYTAIIKNYKRIHIVNG